MQAKAVVAGLALLAVALAGCTGSFNVKQTEPIRVQLDGTGQQVKVADGGQPQSVAVDTNGAQKVVLQVDAQSAASSAKPSTVIVKVQDEDTKEVIVERTVVVQPSQPASQSIDVDVRGNHNLVVVTQSKEGDATVNIAAHGAAAAGGPLTSTETGAMSSTTDMATTTMAPTDNATSGSGY